MGSTLAQITVTIPEDRAAELMAFVATLFDKAGDRETPGPTPPVLAPDGRPSAEALAAAAGLVPEAVRTSFYGGQSESWRPFLVYLASRPDEWVPWPDLYAALGLTKSQAAGMLGAAERRCKGQPPYIKRHESGEHHFWMPADTAELIRSLP